MNKLKTAKNIGDSIENIASQDGSFRADGFDCGQPGLGVNPGCGAGGIEGIEALGA